MVSNVGSIAQQVCAARCSPALLVAAPSRQQRHPRRAVVRCANRTIWLPSCPSLRSLLQRKFTNFISITKCFQDCPACCANCSQGRPAAPEQRQLLRFTAPIARRPSGGCFQTVPAGARIPSSLGRSGSKPPAQQRQQGKRAQLRVPHKRLRTCMFQACMHPFAAFRPQNRSHTALHCIPPKKMQLHRNLW